MAETTAAPATANAEAAALHLQRAAEEIEKALVRLDTRMTHCGECGAEHHANHLHRTVYMRVTDTPAKLREHARRLLAAETGGGRLAADRRGR